MKGQTDSDSAEVNFRSLIKYFGLLLGRKLKSFLVEADIILGNIVRGDWHCPYAVSYGRYVPCGGNKCPFHINPIAAGIFWIG